MCHHYQRNSQQRRDKRGLAFQSWVFGDPKLSAVAADMLVSSSMSASSDLALLKGAHLNAASFHSPSTLVIDISTENNTRLCTLINSGSSDCFINSRFAISNNFKLENLEKPLWLYLFNRSSTSSSLIVQYTNLIICLPCGAHIPSAFSWPCWTTLCPWSLDICGYADIIHWLTG